MSVTTLCSICEAAVGAESCNLCGRGVCRDHYDTETGVCTACASGTRVR